MNDSANYPLSTTQARPESTDLILDSAQHRLHGFIGTSGTVKFSLGPRQRRI